MLEELCFENNCIYDACRAPKCSDKIELSCSLIHYVLIMMVNATDTLDLTKDTCFSITRRNYKWSADNKFVECETLIDGSFDFQIVFGSLLFIFIGLRIYCNSSMYILLIYMKLDSSQFFYKMFCNYNYSSFQKTENVAYFRSLPLLFQEK